MGKTKIVLVEDDDGMHEFISSIISESYASEVTRFSAGDTALNYVETCEESEFQTVDLFLIDRMLPGSSGETIVKSIRKRSKIKPILMLSALGDVEHRVEGLGYGATDYLAKPFSPAELVARIESHIRIYREYRLDISQTAMELEFRPDDVSWIAQHESLDVQNLIGEVTKKLVLLIDALNADNTQTISRIAKGQILSVLKSSIAEFDAPLVSREEIRRKGSRLSEIGEKLEDTAISHGIGGLFKQLAEALFKLAGMG